MVLTVAEILKKGGIPKTLQDKCRCHPDCKKVIEEHPDETRYIGKKPVSTDCYFKGLSKHYDKHPIITPPEEYLN